MPRVLAMVVLLAAAPVLAGCLGDAPESVTPFVEETPELPVGRFLHTPGGFVDLANATIVGNGTTPDPALVANWTVTPMAMGTDVAEPTIGITSAGNVFVVANTRVLRSSDHGATWQDVTPAVNAPVTLDPMLYVDPLTDRVFVNQLYLGCSYLAFSDDEGDTWIVNPAACGLPVNDHQTIVAGVPRTGGVDAPLVGVAYPNVLYYGYNAFATTGDSRVSASYDGGLAWRPSTTALPDDECAGGLHGHLVTGPEGRVYMPKGVCGGVAVAMSDDHGVTWTSTLVGESVGWSASRDDPSLTTDAAGNVYLVWPGEDLRAYLSVSRDHGATWTEPMLLSPPDVTATVFATSIGGSDGRVAWSFIGTRDDTSQWEELHSGRTDAHVNWTLFVGMSLDALADEPVFLTFEIGDDADPIQRGGITNLGANEFAARNLLDFYDMGVDKEGRIYVSYTDGCLGRCATADATYEDSRARAGFVAVLERGPSLFADLADLDTPATWA